MQKIILNGGQEFEIESILVPNDKELVFTVNGVKSYEEFKLKLTIDAFSDVRAYTGETLIGNYGCFDKLDYPIVIKENEDGTSSVTVTLIKDDLIINTTRKPDLFNNK
jgi:hypothetical protein